MENLKVYKVEDGRNYYIDDNTWTPSGLDLDLILFSIRFYEVENRADFKKQLKLICEKYYLFQERFEYFIPILIEKYLKIIEKITSNPNYSGRKFLEVINEINNDLFFKSYLDNKKEFKKIELAEYYLVLLRNIIANVGCFHHNGKYFMDADAHWIYTILIDKTQIDEKIVNDFNKWKNKQKRYKSHNNISNTIKKNTDVLIDDLNSEIYTEIHENYNLVDYNNVGIIGRCGYLVFDKNYTVYQHENKIIIKYMKRLFACKISEIVKHDDTNIIPEELFIDEINEKYDLYGNEIINEFKEKYIKDYIIVLSNK